MDEDIINNINKRLDNLESNYKLIEEKNKEYENRIQKNEDLIENLYQLIKGLNIKIKKRLFNLEKDFNKKFKKLQNKENFEEKNEIIINNKIDHNDNDLFDLNKIYEEMGKIINKKLEEFEVYLYESLGKKLKKNLIDKKEENKETKKNSYKDDKNEIIEFKGKNLVEELESKLTKIMSDKNLTIELNDIIQLKKISATLLIKKADPLEMINLFFKDNYNNNELDPNKKGDIGSKKVQIFNALQDMSLKKVEAIQEEQEYIKEFRDKYGITEKDYDDKSLKKLMAKYKKKEKEIIKDILKKLKYLNKND